MKKISEEELQKYADEQVTCRKCNKIDRDGCYSDSFGWLCNRHFDQWLELERIFLDEYEE